jgi:hypothetical protein
MEGVTLPPPVDGFTLDCKFRIMPGLSGALLLGQLDLLRRGRNFRPRWFAFPHPAASSVVPVLAAREAFEEQFRVEPGSWWWGWKCSSSSVAIQITEEETGRKFCSDFQVPNYHRSAPGTWFSPNLLTEPWLILDPGLLNVEMHSTSDSQITVQLVLMFSEPVCAVERGVDPCRR